MITDFCVICGSKDELQIHHIVPKSAPYNIKPTGDMDGPTNLLTLCTDHHGWIHGCRPNQWNNAKALQAEGIRKAKQAGKFKGRPAKIDMKEIQRVVADGNSIRRTAKMLGVSKSTVQRAKRAARAAL